LTKKTDQQQKIR